jgi:hypothetical protein
MIQIMSRSISSSTELLQFRPPAEDAARLEQKQWPTTGWLVIWQSSILQQPRPPFAIGTAP